jgi:hypothetical protein
LHGGAGLYVAGVTVHTAAMLVVAGAIAWLVYRRLGVAVVRQAWFNLDRLWAAALIAAGAAAVL